MAEHSIVRARGLTVNLAGTPVLDGLDMTVPRGSVTVLLGRNGAGKTTLIRAMATLQPVSAGALSVAGHDVRAQPREVRSRIALAGQHTALVNELTGAENLRLVARLAGVRRRDLGAAVDRIVGEFGLRAFAGGRVATYSGGQRRRLDLATTFVRRPELLLLDEPTTGLDPRSRKVLWRRVAELPGVGTSVVLTTQNLEEAHALADWVAVIDRGRIVRSGSPDALRHELKITALTVATRKALLPSEVQSLGAALGATVTHYDGTRLTLAGRFHFGAAVAAIGQQGLAAHEITEFALAPPGLEDVLHAAQSPETR